MRSVVLFGVRDRKREKKEEIKIAASLLNPFHTRILGQFPPKTSPKTVYVSQAKISAHL